MIVDLHCDLLSHPTFSHLDDSVRCSPQQLIDGKVSVQVCAMYTDAYHSCNEYSYENQNRLFCNLPTIDKRIFLLSFDTQDFIESPLQCIRSIENASLLGGDDEKLNTILSRLTYQVTLTGPLAYIGIVWNFKNRFGGGCLERGGLSQDGKDLLEVMAILGIPLDLSHCSDSLAEDILDYRVNKLPTLSVLASHSNFRSVKNHCRNILDEHAKEVARCGGVIGLNLLRDFLGNSLTDIQLHIDHANKLGILHHLSLGTDFFYSEESHKFFPECSKANQHPIIHSLIQKNLSQNEYDNILSQTAKTFLLKTIQTQKKCLHRAKAFLNFDNRFKASAF